MDLKWYLQRAITSLDPTNLAAVSFKLDDTNIIISFYFENAPSDEDIEAVGIAISEFYADLPYGKYKLDDRIIPRRPNAQELTSGQTFVFQER